MNCRLPQFVLPICVVLALCQCRGWAADDTNGMANMALVATPSASFCSGDTTVAALNDGFDPRSSADRQHPAYGNWPQTNTEWVQYEWSRPISTKQIDVYWWASSRGRGVGVPKACRLLYWDGNDFVPVNNSSGLGVARNAYNTTTFDEVRTTKLRLEIDPDDGHSTGILEWKVYDSGKSPILPPAVNAGIDRDVVKGGKTYLSGSFKSAQPGQIKTV